MHCTYRNLPAFGYSIRSWSIVFAHTLVMFERNNEIGAFAGRPSASVKTAAKFAKATNFDVPNRG